MTSNKPPKKYNPAKMSSQKDDSKLTYILGGVAVVAIIALIVIFVVLPGTKGTETQGSGYGTLKDATVQVTDNSTVFVGSKDAPTVLDLYEDFMCPACGQFERQYGGALNEAIDEGQVAVNYHMLNFLNRQSPSGDYSTRAAAAALCVADTGDAAAFSGFHSKMFAVDTQPAEGRTDLTNDEIADVAKGEGAPEESVSCIKSGDNESRATDGAKMSTEGMSAKNDGQVGTPAVFVGDEKVEIGNPKWLEEIVG